MVESDKQANRHYQFAEKVKILVTSSSGYLAVGECGEMNTCDKAKNLVIYL